VEKQEVFKIVREKMESNSPRRKALSLRYPSLLPSILGTKRFINNFKNSLNFKISKQKSLNFFECVIARHSSPLFRKLGESDPALQKGKIKNLELAIKALNGLIIPPNKVFSFWAIVGAASKRRGYVNGMLLSDGKVIEGVGGGLCQLSNLLYWLFLHSPVEIIERKHHSRDVFPDSGRTIPFGTGATIFYNLIDLKIKNTFTHSIQLKLWLSDSQLKGQVLSSQSSAEKYHIKEREHCFVQTNKGIYRYNEIWRETLVDGQITKEEKLITNCAPVLYDIRDQDILSML
jgi:vancomycin resistance protein VanW